MTAADVGGFRGLGPQWNGMSLPWLLEPSQRMFADTRASGAEVSQRSAEATWRVLSPYAWGTVMCR